MTRTNSGWWRAIRGTGRAVVWMALGAAIVYLVAVDPFDRFGSESGPGGSHADDAASQGALWTCGMHPQVLMDEPGQCPICRMDLVPVKEGHSTDEHAMTPEPVVAERSRAEIRIDPTVIQNMNVRTAPVVRRDIRHRVRTVGYLEYDQERMVTVTTKYEGWVETVYTNYVGERVEKGQPLFEIYAPELVQTQQELLSALEYVDRLEGAGEAAQERAEALAEAARLRLTFWDIAPDQIRELEASGELFRTLKVVAPASGLVMKRVKGLEGMAVKPGMEIFHIADLSTLWLSVEIFEDQISWIEVGSTAEIEFSYFPGEVFSGTVRIIEPALSEQTRTLPVRLLITNVDGRLRSGMYATVNFSPTAAVQAISVPSTSVLRTGERDLVVVELEPGRFLPKAVVLGHEGDGYVEVIEGVEPGDQVVTSAQFLLDSEASLQAAVQTMMSAQTSGHSH